MPVRIVSIDDVRAAERVIREHASPAPLIRSCALERELGMPANRRVWLKDYGWTPSGSFKLLGALNWMANNRERLNGRPVAALLDSRTDLAGDGDVVVVVSGRNVDDDAFRKWIAIQ